MAPPAGLLGYSPLHKQGSIPQWSGPAERMDSGIPTPAPVRAWAVGKFPVKSSTDEALYQISLVRLFIREIQLVQLSKFIAWPEWFSTIFNPYQVLIIKPG